MELLPLSVRDELHAIERTASAPPLPSLRDRDWLRGADVGKRLGSICPLIRRRGHQIKHQSRIRPSGILPAFGETNMPPFLQTPPSK
jgi:hypothetical protein